MDDDKSVPTNQEAKETKTQVVYKEKNRLSNIFTRTLLSLLLIAAGAALVWMWLMQRDLNKESSAKNSQIAQLNSDKASLQQQVGALRTSQPQNPATEENALSDQLLLAAKAYVSADVNVKNMDAYAFNISKQNDDFGRVSVGVPEGSGYYIIFKRSIKQWVPIISGQDTVPQAVADRYGIPSEFR